MGLLRDQLSDLTEKLKESDRRLQQLEEMEYQAELAALFMNYDCEDPEDQKIIQRKLKELNASSKPSR